MTMFCPRTTRICCRNRRLPPRRASVWPSRRFWTSDSSRSPKIGFDVQGHLQSSPGTLGLGGRERREALYGVEVLGTLQSVQKSHHAAIVTYHLSVDGQFCQVAAFQWFGFERTTVQSQAGFSGKLTEFGADRRISGALREKRVLEGIAILLNRGNVAANFQRALDVFFQQVAVDGH